MSPGDGRPDPEIIPPGVDVDPRAPYEDVFDGVSDGAVHSLTMARLTYVLYAIASISGFPMIIGLVLAYVARSEAPAWQKTHCMFLIYTFWFGLALIVVGMMTWIIGIGMFLLWILPLWYVIRVVRGWVLLENRQPVPNPKSLLFG